MEKMAPTDAVHGLLEQEDVQLFCMAMAWSSALTAWGLRHVVMYVWKWVLVDAVAASWQEGPTMLISWHGRTEVAVHRKCHYAVDMKGLFWTCEIDSPSAEWTSGLVPGATFDYKNLLIWAHLQWDWQNSTGKIVCFFFLLLISICVASRLIAYYTWVALPTNLC